jgi:hypothetical protein
MTFKMKALSYLSIGFCLVMVISGCTKNVLEKTPQGVQTPQTFYEDSTQAILGINAIYDAASWEQGPGAGSNLRWMYGDVLSDDAEKGSTPGDFIQLQEMKEWRANPATSPARDTYYNMYQAIFRANAAIVNMQNALWNSPFKQRLLGEAYFLRGYCYFYLLRVFGGVPLITEPLTINQFGTVARASFSETARFIEDNFMRADSVLPVRSGYAQADIGRATKGAVEAYMARLNMYEIGTDNTHGHSWQQVYDLTNKVISSGEYALVPNYAQVFQQESENSRESIFEIQYSETSSSWGPVSTGTTNNVFQNNRNTWGWGFNNPTQSLASAFEPNDPRKPNTMYTTGDVIVGIRQVVPYPEANFTGYLNSKAVIPTPGSSQGAGQNIREFRYADLLLMNAEAAAHIGLEAQAISHVNTIRARARRSTMPKGSVVGNANAYAPFNAPETILPDIPASLTGQNLLKAIYHERRVELGMEALRFWDMVRTGTYFSALPADISARALSHSITTGVVNPIPVLPLPLTEVQSWNLQQNPGY